jgi:hypothetical protein
MGWFVSAYEVVGSAFCVSIIYPNIQDNSNNKVQEGQNKYRVCKKAL